MASPQKWIESLEILCDNKKADELGMKCYVFRNSLSVDVLNNWFTKLDNEIRNDWEELKRAFKKKYIKLCCCTLRRTKLILPEGRGLMNLWSHTMFF